MGTCAVHAGEKIHGRDGQAPLRPPPTGADRALRAVNRRIFRPARKLLTQAFFQLKTRRQERIRIKEAKKLTARSSLIPSQVRLYTAKKIHEQLEAARTEFIQGSVAVRKQALLLPKVLHYYARDAGLELRHLVELVCESMSDAQREAAQQLQQCLRRRADRCVEWMPYKSSFRYVVHRDLADD